jgi:hypothetical protein
MVTSVCDLMILSSKYYFDMLGYVLVVALLMIASVG